MSEDLCEIHRERLNLNYPCYDCAQETIARLTEERDRLRKLVDEQYVDAEEFAGELDQRHQARLQGIREGLEWAAKEVEQTFVFCDPIAATIRAGDPKQIAAEADKEAQP